MKARDGPKRRRKAIEKANSYVAKGQPKRALAHLDVLERSGQTPPNILLPKINALLQLQRFDEAARLARRAARRKNVPAPLKAAIVTALVKGGGVKAAGRFLRQNLGGRNDARLLTKAVVAALEAGRPDFILRHKSAIRTNAVSLSRCITLAVESRMTRSLARDRDSLAEIERIISAVGGLTDLVTDIAEAYRICRILFCFGDSGAANRYLALFSGLAQSQPALSLPWQDDAPAPLAPFGKLQDQKALMLADWLNITADARDHWVTAMRRNAPEYEQLMIALHASPRLFDVFADMIEPPDWAPVHALADKGQPAVFVTTHLGLLMGTFTQLAAQNLPVSIIGGNLMSQKLLPGGEMFLPFSIVEPDTTIARKMIKRLRAGKMTALSSDGLRGAGIHRYFKDGHMFHLSDSAARLSVRNRLPVFWVCTFWRDGKLVMEVEAAPAPRKNESIKRYRRRFFDYYYRKSRAVALADPRNVKPFANVVRTPNMFYPLSQYFPILEKLYFRMQRGRDLK